MNSLPKKLKRDYRYSKGGVRVGDLAKIEANASICEGDQSSSNFRLKPAKKNTLNHLYSFALGR